MAELTTQRLMLRSVVSADWAELAALIGDQAVAERTTDTPFPFTPEAAESLLSPGGASDVATFVIVRTEDDALLGAITLIPLDNVPVAQLKVWLGKPHWRQGFGTEVVRRILLFAFRERNFTAVRTYVMGSNEAALHLLSKVGFREDYTAMPVLPERGGIQHIVITLSATRASFAQAALSQAVGRS